jgi:hypothetical protein
VSPCPGPLPPKRKIRRSHGSNTRDRWSFNTGKELKATAKTIGAEPVGTIFTGLAGKAPRHRISAQVRTKAGALAAKLA